MSEEQKPYRIQWAQSSEYDIVGPEGKTPRSWLKTEAENIAQWMNHAYAAGLAAKDAELARLRSVVEAARHCDHPHEVCDGCDCRPAAKPETKEARP